MLPLLFLPSLPFAQSGRDSYENVEYCMKRRIIHRKLKLGFFFSSPNAQFQPLQCPSSHHNPLGVFACTSAPPTLEVTSCFSHEVRDFWWVLSRVTKLTRSWWNPWNGDEDSEIHSTKTQEFTAAKRKGSAGLATEHECQGKSLV